MKTIILSFMLALSGAVVAQSSSYSFGENPMTTPTNIKLATTVSDLSPLLWRYLGLPARDRFAMDYYRKQDSAQGYYIQPPLNNYPNIVNVVFVTITTVTNGKRRSAHSTNASLTVVQKKILESADMSSNIEIRINFTFKNLVEIKEGRIAITIVPEQEALFKEGNFNAISDYLNEYVTARYVSPTVSQSIENASIQFTVQEDGSLSDIHMRQLSGNSRIDQLLMEAMQQMPKWKPARNANGVPVKQKIYFTSGGC